MKGPVPESSLRIRWPKYRSFSFSISPSNEYSGLISFRMDWLDLLAVQGTLKSLLQHHSSKASVEFHLPFFVFILLVMDHLENTQFMMGCLPSHAEWRCPSGQQNCAQGVCHLFPPLT